MASMYERIETLCNERGVNITQMCRESGIPRATLSELKMGRTAALSAKNMDKLIAYFQISADVLLGNDEENKKTPTPEGERDYLAILNAFNKADESTREAILLLLKLK